MSIFFFFFFQAEDGIRDYKVTGVQTCALPIWRHHSQSPVTAVNGVSGHPCSGDRCLKSALQHLCGKLGLGRELDLFWNASLRPTLGVVRPALLGQVQSPVNESRPLLRGIAEEHADLAVLLLARSTRVLWLNPNRLGPFLQEAGLVDDEHQSKLCYL